ncbi:hypothetical protein LguiB_026721 [Lonicera macranthoides]
MRVRTDESSLEAHPHVPKKSGSLASILCFICWLLASSLANHMGFSVAWKELGLHWTPYKKSKVLKTLRFEFQLSQALQMFFGFEPYPGFHASMKARIEADIKYWQDNKSKKKNS